ncbi:hypothetical protein [Sphingobium cupriresistens]|uniref:Uncharacterized protein n=1 Tax=Sphingobium cupriresistens LL01 TaxID=1420583 RepID=A0A0J7Y655_9SPHN|nr:hypothetical protein [Sphingobium cupriresistens]KMS58863.1 hypothetical protein V473_10805 [Sphingobium cupriresistens LL01]
MTIALAIWLIFKTIALSLASLIFAVIAACLLIGGALAAHEDVRPRWLPATLLAFGLVFVGGGILTMNKLAQVILA